MKNEHLDGFFNKMKNETLTPIERASMREMLRMFVHEHPARAPFVIRARDAVASWSGTFDTLASRGLVPSALALVLVISTGTSYAAQTALPGDLLYPVKIHINEALEGALVSSDAERATWNAQLVTRRLEEAEELLAEGRLTPIARAHIESSIALSTADFNTNVAKLAASDDPTDAAAVQSNLEASLSGHEQVLTALALADKSESVAPILESVVVRKTAVSTGRSKAEAQVAKQSSTTVKRAALATQQEAKKAIEDARAALSSALASGASTTIVLTASTTDAIDTAAAGDADLQNGDYQEAFESFQAATRAAQMTQVHIEAQVRLKKALRTEHPNDTKPAHTIEF